MLCILTVFSINQPEDGGLGFQSESIGIASAVGGAVLMIFQLFIYPKIALALGMM